MASAENDEKASEQLLDAPPAWAASVTWVDGECSMTLPDAESTRDITVTPMQERGLEVKVKEEAWILQLPARIEDSRISIQFDTHLRVLRVRLSDKSVEESAGALERMRLKADENAELDRTWCDRRAMFGESTRRALASHHGNGTEALIGSQVVQGALEVSEYTDVVDCYHGMSLQASGYRGFGFHGGGLGYGTRSSSSTKANKIVAQLEDMLATCSGLELASHYKRGKALVCGNSFRSNAEFFGEAFELSRRFKVTNPTQMRSSYGKMMYMLQDSRAGGGSSCGVPERSADPLGFELVYPLRTVHSLLADKGGLELLADPDLEAATTPILFEDPEQMKQEAERSAAAPAGTQAAGYSDDIEQCLYSISDGMTYAASNTRPVILPFDCTDEQLQVAKMISYLKKYFGGRGGSCLSHNHTTQYTFVLQSLTLWREIMSKLYRCWHAADADLLSARHTYRLVNTGQGLNRVQSAPNVSHLMQSILSKVQREAGGWVGLSVVHLGDRDVPNALWFIDKYNQVPLILGPLANVLEQLDELATDPGVAGYLERMFGGVHEAKMEILCDFFKHAFDGSGDDGGSCIDGRLTSAWNWCSKISKKKYYNVFLLAGFKSFDGA